MSVLFAFHHCSAYTHRRYKRGGRSLPPAAGGAIKQPTRGVGDPGGGFGGGVKRGEQEVGKCEGGVR